VDTHKLREKLAMLVTDNAANMVLARRLVVESDGFKHILQMRWVGGLHVYTFHVYVRCCLRCCMVLLCAVRCCACVYCWCSAAQSFGSCPCAVDTFQK
jgi:hypothetical protein